MTTEKANVEILVAEDTAWGLISTTQWPLPKQNVRMRQLGEGAGDNAKLDLLKRLVRVELGVSLGDIRDEPEKYLEAAKAAAEGFHGAVRGFARRLEDAIDEACPNLGDYTYVSDDSFSDVVYHIIGLGKDTYNEVMAQLQNTTLVPQDRAGEVIRRLQTRDYQESFAYLIPYDVDVDNLVPETYVSRMERLKEYHDGGYLTMTLHPFHAGDRDPYSHISSKDFDAMKETLGLIEAGKWDEALEVYLTKIDPVHGINPPICQIIQSGYLVPNLLNEYFLFVKEGKR